MNIRFLPEADAEFREAARYYEDRAPGLGLAFIAEGHRCAAILATQPGIGVWVDKELGLRKYGLRRFPYNLIYVVDGKEIIVAAAAHHKRRPFYWAKRLWK